MKNILILLGVFSLKAVDQKENTPISYTEEEQKLVNKLFDQYKPTAKNCGPAIQEGVEGCAESLPNLTSIEGGLTCLLYGCKNVFMGDIDETSKPLKQILYKNQISCFYSCEDLLGGCRSIFYTPKGKLYASLLLKTSLLDIPCLSLSPKFHLINNDDDYVCKHDPDLLAFYKNHYITGHLLGYSDADILAFYNHIAKQFYKDINPKEEFENDKKVSLEWIKKNELDIDEWINDNSLKYDIQNIDFSA